MEKQRLAAAIGGRGSSEASVVTLTKAVQALGRGFDVTADARLLYCKGAPGSRLLLIDESSSRPFDLLSSDDGGAVIHVPEDVEICRDAARREPTHVCSFQQMAEYFNKKSGLSETVPLGTFNLMFSFTGCRKVDAAATKALAMDGYLIPLYKVKLKSDGLVLTEEVKRAVPRSWDPSLLARSVAQIVKTGHANNMKASIPDSFYHMRSCFCLQKKGSFIENFGTHVITSVTIGGKDVVYIKQHHSSQLSASDIEKYVKEIGDQRFLNLEHQSFADHLNYKDKSEDRSHAANRDNGPLISGKEDVTVIFRRRGGDDLVQNHAEWTKTVPLAPDVVNMTFCPIVSLLDGVPGIQYLDRAINLYLEYKPPIEELQYFLEFQLQRLWAPAPTTIPGHQRREPVSPSLQFSLMGPKLYISPEQVSVGRKPVTGLRLCLEGSKQNRLAIHLQHLASLPKILLPHWDRHVSIGPPKWQGPEEQDSRWFEPIKWKNFAHVSTAPIENTESNIGDLSGVYIVTGAQLGMWDFGAKSVLHLKLLFSKVPGCTIRRSVWDHSPTSYQTPSLDDPSSSSSSENPRLLKIVDPTEMSKGPQDTPGHWLVTGAKLGVERGKIVVRVKYSLLNY